MMGGLSISLFSAILLFHHGEDKKAGYLQTVLKDRNHLQAYLDKRPTAIRNELGQFFHKGDSYPCHVKGPGGVDFKIDGYLEKGGYSGWYFEGLPITIEVIGINRNHFAHWIVNGKKITSTRLVYPVRTKTEIEAVFQ